MARVNVLMAVADLHELLPNLDAAMIVLGVNMPRLGRRRSQQTECRMLDLVRAPAFGLSDACCASGALVRRVPPRAAARRQHRWFEDMDVEDCSRPIIARGETRAAGV